MTTATAITRKYGRIVRRHLPPTLRLRELFFYNPETGSLTWRQGRKIGKEAGAPDHAGYKRVMVAGIAYQVHRVIWKMCAWADPEHEIDHVNSNKSDNRWLNLRPATITQNARNRRLQVNNKSGFKGVYWHVGSQRWCAKIVVDRQQIHLGYFEDAALAHSAYTAAATEHHGRFARAQ